MLGFYSDLSEKTCILNNLISFICYTIYKYKMKSRFNNERMSEENLKSYVKNWLVLYNSIVKKTGKIRNNLYNDLANCL